MGIKNYVRQVRPVQESYVNHLDKYKQSLKERYLLTDGFFTKRLRQSNKDNFNPKMQFRIY